MMGYGKLTPAGYAGYVSVEISSSSSSGYIDYTVNGPSPTCQPAAAAKPAPFWLFSTAEVCYYQMCTAL
jgi:hypothetical protein